MLEVWIDRETGTIALGCNVYDSYVLCWYNGKQACLQHYANEAVVESYYSYEGAL